MKTFRASEWRDVLPAMERLSSIRLKVLARGMKAGIEGGRQSKVTLNRSFRRE